MWLTRQHEPAQRARVCLAAHRVFLVDTCDLFAVQSCVQIEHASTAVPRAITSCHCQAASAA